MKANELMIEDWVYRPDCYDKVKEIRNTGVIGIDNMRGLIAFSEIEPIPLIPEILEKNGWVCEYFGKRQEWWLDKTKFPIVRYSTNGTLQHNGIVLKHVHQLQHALRLCGIEKAIEL